MTSLPPDIDPPAGQGYWAGPAATAGALEIARLRAEIARLEEALREAERHPDRVRGQRAREAFEAFERLERRR